MRCRLILSCTLGESGLSAHDIIPGVSRHLLGILPPWTPSGLMGLSSGAEHTKQPPATSARYATLRCCCCCCTAEVAGPASTRVRSGCFAKQPIALRDL
jgi:hypothetical protein